MKKRLFTYLLILFTGSALHAQNVEPSCTIDRDTILAGQPIRLELSLKTPDTYSVTWNIWEDTLSATVELVDRNFEKKEKNTGKGFKKHTQLLNITSFEPGENEIPSLPIVFSNSDSLTFTAYTEPLYFYVRQTEVDTSLAIRDLKKPLSEPVTFKEASSYAGLAAIIAAIVLAIIFIVRRTKSKEPIIPVRKEPEIPAIDTARTEMCMLKLKQLWQVGKIKEYYTELTDIVRKYIEGQFKVQAVELTSSEILEGIRPLKINSQAYSKLKETLEIADLVKFAKFAPSNTDNDLYYTYAETFIEESYAHFIDEQRKQEELEREAGTKAETEKEVAE